MYDVYGVSEGDFNIQDITTKTGKGYGMTGKGTYVNLKNNQGVGGYCKHFSTGYSDIHISPYYSGGDLVNFQAVAGHELIHAYHYYVLPTVNTINTERVAYKYTYKTYLDNGYLKEAMRTMQRAMFNPSGSFWGHYPIEYQIPSPYKFF